VAILFAENLDKTEEGVQRSWNSYQRLFYDNGFVNVEDLKKIRNEMDLLDIGVRKRYALCLLQSASRPSAICKQVFCPLPVAFCLLPSAFYRLAAAFLQALLQVLLQVVVETDSSILPRQASEVRLLNF
jgi:hypothetical protein